MELEPVIGLEIHVQQKTDSKMFCPCSNDGENQPPNSCICPICLGHPGMLPIANKQSIQWAALASLALHCEIAPHSKFDRKHYFYPDLPKAYQISQFDKPIGKNGFVLVPNETGGEDTISINRLHLEEDAAKLTHEGHAATSAVDYNRGGTPLMEIVSEPDITTPAQAKRFLQELRTIVRYLGVSDADMEKGHLRCDANISLRPKGDTALYPKTEIKNVNSFRNVERALEYEIKRQTKIWNETGEAPQKLTTRGFNAETGTTEEQREKEESHDYRYFPEPDIPPIHFVREPMQDADPHAITINLTAIERALPELPGDRRKRFIAEYAIPHDDALVLASDQVLAGFTENVMSELQAWFADTSKEEWETVKSRYTRMASGFLINKVLPLIADDATWKSRLSAENFAELITLLAGGTINAPVATVVLEEMLRTGGDPSTIIESKGLSQISDVTMLETFITEVIAEHPQAVADIQAGKEKALQALVGMVMGKSKGTANPQVVMGLLKKHILK